MMQACLDYSWPGNLRELSNFMKRYLVLGDEKLAIQELQPRTTRQTAQGDEASHAAPVKPAGGLKSLARSAKDEAEAEAINGPRRNQLEPQAGRGAIEDQLQSPALQNPPVRNRADEKPQS